MFLAYLKKTKKNSTSELPFKTGALQVDHIKIHKLPPSQGRIYNFSSRAAETDTPKMHGVMGRIDYLVTSMNVRLQCLTY